MLKIALYFFLDKKEGMEMFFRSAILVASTTCEVLKSFFLIQRAQLPLRLLAVVNSLKISFSYCLPRAIY